MDLSATMSTILGRSCHFGLRSLLMHLVEYLKVSSTKTFTKPSGSSPGIQCNVLGPAVSSLGGAKSLGLKAKVQSGI